LRIRLRNGLIKKQILRITEKIRAHRDSIELLPKNHASVSAIEQNFASRDVVALTMQHCGRCATMAYQSASQPPLPTVLPCANGSRYSIRGAVRESFS